jgi:hypothetical protein
MSEGAGAFDTVLFTHWLPDYQAYLTELVETQAPARAVKYQDP